MKYQLRVTAAAFEDMEDAAIWYENQRAGLGQQFLAAVQKGFKVIESAPLRHPFADDNKKRKNIFSYLHLGRTSSFIMWKMI